MKGLVFEVLLNLSWSGNQLRELLDKVSVKNRPIDRFLVSVELPNIGRRMLHLSARPLRQGKSTPDRIPVILEDVTSQELPANKCGK